MSEFGAEVCECTHNFVGPPMGNYCGGGSFLTFMTLLQYFINGRCVLKDPCNRVVPKEYPDYEYDFIVVGGGTAGAIVASRLSENPSWKVLLLEAGNDEPTPAQVPALLLGYWGNPATDWMYRTEPQTSACLGNPEQRCTWPRAKLLGGNSVFNGMMYMRGVPSDYDNWEKQDEVTGWSYADVLPYFKKSEDNSQLETLVDSNYHAKGGVLTVEQFRHHPKFADDLLKAADELGYGISKNLNGDNITGFAIAQATTRNGMRLSTARAFLWPASKRPNLHVMLNSTVTRVVVDPTTKNADDIEFIYQGKPLSAKATKEVIISAGTINSPKLLLQSGIGNQDDLETLNIPLAVNLPGVGQNLQNHVAFSIRFILGKANNTNDLNWVSVAEYLLQQSGPLSSPGLSQVTARLNSKYANEDGQSPDLQFFFYGFSAMCAQTGSVNELNDPVRPRSFTATPVVLHPKSRGYISLRSSNPDDPPIMQPNYFNDDYDVTILIDAIKTIMNLENSKILQAKYGIQLDRTPIRECADTGAWGSDAYWRCAIQRYTIPENHQVGTSKMGPSTDEMAVVDSELRVYGVNGLRVIDASVMPTIPSGNTAAPTMMIAERGADFIKSDWGFKETPKKVTSTDSRYGGPFRDSYGSVFSNFSGHHSDWRQRHYRPGSNKTTVKHWYYEEEI